MNGKSRTILTLATVASAFITLAAWAWLTGSSSQAAGETASIEPASQEAGLGDSITVSVVASGVTDMVGFQCDLSFSNTVFEVTDIDLGDGLGSWPSEVDSLAATRETPGGTAEYLNGLTDPSATLLTEINSDGGLRIGTSNTVPFTDEKALDGTGTLAIISFDIMGDPGLSSTLDLNDCGFSVGLPSPSTITPTEQDGEAEGLPLLTPTPTATATPPATPTPSATATPAATPPTATATPTPTLVVGSALPMVAGWNVRCYIGDRMNVEDALAGITDKVLAVSMLNQSQAFDRWFPDRPDVSTLTTLDPYDQLFVLMSEASTWRQEKSTQTQPSVNLLQGWNSVCYTGQTKPVEEATAAIAETIGILYKFLDTSQAWERYVPARPSLSTISTLTQLDSVILLVTEEAGMTWVFDP